MRGGIFLLLEPSGCGRLADASAISIAMSAIVLQPLMGSALVAPLFSQARVRAASSPPQSQVPDQTPSCRCCSRPHANCLYELTRSRAITLDEAVAEIAEGTPH